MFDDFFDSPTVYDPDGKLRVKAEAEFKEERTKLTRLLYRHAGVDLEPKVIEPRKIRNTIVADHESYQEGYVRLITEFIDELKNVDNHGYIALDTHRSRILLHILQDSLEILKDRNEILEELDDIRQAEADRHYR